MTPAAGLARDTRSRVFGRPAPRHRRPRRRRLAQRIGIALAICGAAAVALGLGGWALTSHPAENPQADGVPKVRVPSGLHAAEPRSPGKSKVARPVRLIIPTIGVSTSLVRLGLTAAGSLQVPGSASVAGWFTGSARPGAVGSSIIVGHIDSRVGPGVFYRLGRMQRGQHVYVVRADRSVATFKVTLIRAVAKTAFPSAAVYGPVPDAELRIITCGGSFDYATGSYLSNVVVYATLVPRPVTAR